MRGLFHRNVEPEEKCWGEVQHLFYADTMGVSLLRVDRGWRCSIHKHASRNNMFCVHSGELIIETWSQELDSEKRDLVLLTPGDVLDVPAGIWHRFRVYRSGQLTEIYTPSDGGVVRFDDIERFDEGGEDNIEELRFTLNELGLR